MKKSTDHLFFIFVSVSFVLFVFLFFRLLFHTLAIDRLFNILDGVFAPGATATHSVDKRSKTGSLVEIGFSGEKCDKMIVDPFRIVILMLFTSRSIKLKLDFII